MRRGAHGTTEEAIHHAVAARRHAIEHAFAAAPDAVRASVRWLPIGEAVEIEGEPATPVL